MEVDGGRDLEYHALEAESVLSKALPASTKGRVPLGKIRWHNSRVQSSLLLPHMGVNFDGAP